VTLFQTRNRVTLFIDIK